MQENSKGIVVGVDGSDSSILAATWALDEAHRRGCGLTLVHAWRYGLTAPRAPLDGPDYLAMQGDVQATVDAVAALLRLRPESADVAVTSVAIEGPAGPSLVDEAAEAELLVVGSHGHSAFARAVLGSVSTYCVHHSKCSTVIVPTATAARSGRHRATVGSVGSAGSEAD